MGAKESGLRSNDNNRISPWRVCDRTVWGEAGKQDVKGWSGGLGKTILDANVSGGGCDQQQHLHGCITNLSHSHR